MATRQDVVSLKVVMNLYCSNSLWAENKHN